MNFTFPDSRPLVQPSRGLTIWSVFRPHRPPNRVPLAQPPPLPAARRLLSHVGRVCRPVLERVRGDADVSAHGGLIELASPELVAQRDRAPGLDDVLQHAAPPLALLLTQSSHRAAG